MNVLLPCKWQNQCSATVLTYDVARFVCGWLSSQTRCYTQVLHSEKSRWHQSGFGHWGCPWSVSFIAVAVHTWSVVQGVPHSSLTGDVNSHRHKAPSSVLHVDPLHMSIVSLNLPYWALVWNHVLLASLIAWLPQLLPTLTANNFSSTVCPFFSYLLLYILGLEIGLRQCSVHCHASILLPWSYAVLNSYPRVHCGGLFSVILNLTRNSWRPHPQLAKSPSKEELERAVDKLKAGGSSNILPEMVKAACSE